MRSKSLHFFIAELSIFTQPVCPEQRPLINCPDKRLGTQEYKLRRLINQDLGHRNFNEFANGYRIAEVQRRLGDPQSAHLPVLTLALDAGFRSIAPFNRAFKDQTAMTPTDYRRQLAAQSGKSAT